MQKPTSLWNRVHVSWRFVTNLCASVPSDPEVVKKWLDARKPKAKPPQGKSIGEIQEEVVSTLAEPETEFVQLIFQRVPPGLAVRMATIKAHIKDCASVLSSLYIGKIEKEKSFAVRMKNGIYYPPEVYWVPMLRHDGTRVTQADGTLDRFVHTFQGNSLKQFEYSTGARLDFDLLLLGNAVKVNDLHTIFQYGGVHGYAGERGAGEGRYTYTIEEETNG
jgi:hypothetical protein